MSRVAGLLSQLSQQVPAGHLAVNQIDDQQRWPGDLDLLEGLGDEVGRGDVVVLVLQQLRTTSRKSAEPLTTKMCWRCICSVLPGRLLEP